MSKRVPRLKFDDEELKAPEVKKAVKKMKTSVVKEHLAVEFDVEGKGEGAFYVEFTSGGVYAEPYEYYDHDLRIRCDAASALEMLEQGDVSSLSDGRAGIEGEYVKLPVFGKYLAQLSAQGEAEPGEHSQKKPVPKKNEKKPLKKTK